MNPVQQGGSMAWPNETFQLRSFNFAILKNDVITMIRFVFNLRDCKNWHLRPFINYKPEFFCESALHAAAAAAAATQNTPITMLVVKEISINFSSYFKIK